MLPSYCLSSSLCTAICLPFTFFLSPHFVCLSYNQPVSQRVNQRSNQSISHPISQSTSQSVSQSASQSINDPVSQSTSQSVGQSVNHPINHLVDQSANQSAYQSASQSTSQSIWRPVSACINWLIIFNQSLTQRFKHTASQISQSSSLHHQQVSQSVTSPVSILVNQSFFDSLTRPDARSFSRSVGQSVSQPVRQSVRQ